ncbi:hypothetical protein BV898_19744, partial [Hypsibius exemplaris]
MNTGDLTQQRYEYALCRAFVHALLSNPSLSAAPRPGPLADTAAGSMTDGAWRWVWGVEEFNFDHLKFTGVNITAFTMLNGDEDRYKQMNQEWTQLEPEAGWLGAGSPLTNDVALMLDAVHMLVNSLNHLFKERPTVFQNNFRRGEVFNNGSRGLDCTKYPLEFWEHGKPQLTTLIIT